jgi:hypothetical protein
LAKVFFYQSETGGRVFFDELGPPWSKHGCTTSGWPWRRKPGEPEAELETYAWQDAGWSPFLHSVLASITPTLMRLTGYIADEFETFYVPKVVLPRGVDERRSMRSLCHLKKLQEGVFQAAWLLPNTENFNANVFVSNIEAETQATRLSQEKRTEGPKGAVRRSKT